MYKFSYKLNPRGKIIFLTLAAILLIVVVIFSVTKCNKNPEKPQNASTPWTTTEQGISDKNKDKDKDGEKGHEKKSNTGTDSAVQPADNTDVVQKTYTSTPVNAEIGNFFDNSLFVGDSRMQGLMIYSGATGTGYTEPGLDVKTVVSKPFVWHNGSKITIPEALKLATYDRVFIKLGMNELGWRSTEMFISKYGEFVDIVKAAQPDSKIYVMAILPVSEKKNGDGTVYNNARIAEFNGLIQNMVAEKGVNYLDLGSKLADANGFLPVEASTDGIHLTSSYCN